MPADRTPRPIPFTAQEAPEAPSTSGQAKGFRAPAVSLRRKILTGYGSTLLVSVLLVVGSIIGLLKLGQASGAILSENYRSIAAAGAMTRAIARQERAVAFASRGPEPGVMNLQFREAETEFLQALGRARDNITIEGEETIVDAIQTRYVRFLTVASELLGSSSQLAVAPERPETTILAAVEGVLQATDSLREINESTMYRASNSAAAVARGAIWAMAVTGTALVFLGVALALELSRRAVLPLRRLLEATAAVAAGDYRVRVPVTTRDEIGAVTREFNQMVSQLLLYNERSVRRLLLEQQKSEAILRSLEDGVVVLDQTNVVTAMNTAAARLFGAQAGEAVGKHLLEVHRDEQLFRIASQVPAGRHEQAAGENVVAFDREGETRYCMVSVTPIDSSSGEDPGKVLLLRDVTALKELDRLKSEFVSTASHELRGPLTSVAMSVSLLRESVGSRLGDKERMLIEAAEEDLQRLRALVNDLLDLSRLESGRLEMSLVSMSPSAIIERAVELFRAQADRAHIELCATYPDQLPEVRVDATRITWVLTNLLSNALRYTSAGGRIEVTAVSAGRHLHVSVKDSGAGIPPEAQSRIFEKFVRAGPAGDMGGTGLGLAICREIVRSHGGTIWVESEPGKGSTFTFTLPSSMQGGIQ